MRRRAQSRAVTWSAFSEQAPVPSLAQFTGSAGRESGENMRSSTCRLHPFRHLRILGV